MEVLVKAYFEGSSQTPSKFFIVAKGRFSQISEAAVSLLIKNGYNVTISRIHQIPS